MLNLQEGEASLHDDKGQYVYLTASGIVINGGGLPVTVMNAPSVTLDTPVVHLTGSLQVDGDITAGGDVADQGGTKTMAGMRADYNSHKHGTSPLTDHPM
jgi:phage gp45-like